MLKSSFTPFQLQLEYKTSFHNRNPNNFPEEIEAPITEKHYSGNIAKISFHNYFDEQTIQLPWITTNLKSQKMSCIFTPCHSLKMKSWETYYSKVENLQKYENYEFSLQNKSLEISTDYLYVYNCYFHNTRSTFGGAIHQRSGKCFLVERCSFYNCSSSNDTAVIRVTHGNCVIAYVCAQHCKSDTNDGFCSIFANDDKKINNILHSSISHCSANKNHIAYMVSGKIQVQSLNISHNSALLRCGLFCGPNISDTLGATVIYSSFSNNTGDSQCVSMSTQYNNGGYNEIKYVNIIYNRVIYVVYSLGDLIIIESCIMKNENPTFSPAQGNITIVNCSIDSFENITNENIIVVGETFEFIHGLTFIKTGYCKASFDAIGTLTASPPPKPSYTEPIYGNDDFRSFIRNIFYP